ncbi:hypothetical protein TSUD_86840 [Trifolium subterraneum]|uniref:Reverse transcriptase domain-containing protein n=1 Tax=Trifolium subterraneum TaxID=3900 RepID=A0A2Z6NMU4_TRISU|nr:hypothetical protein TSUD_86840 [Trifolium subterraneum]
MRLGNVMDPIISKNQSAFIKGRNLADGVVVVNELVDLAKCTKKKCVIFKVDFDKAYDSVSWSFLDYMLKRIGFGVKWRAWMKACVCCGKLSVLVNGSPTEEVNMSRGLKQGDPLAPSLFLLVSEGLNALTQKAVSLGYFKGFQVSDDVSVSLLQYADDTLFIGEARVENLWAMKAILRWYELISGLKVNFSKSRVIGVHVVRSFMEGAASFLNCTIGYIPFVYLGLPIGANPMLSSTWDPVVKTIEKRLSSWKNKYVSLGGRVVLINSVLASIPGVRDKIPWVSWKDVCRPKSEGGLGVRDLKWFNVSLLAKWRWRMLGWEDLLWKRVLEARYGVVARPNLLLGRGNNFSLWWKDLVGLGVERGVEGDWTREVFIKKLGNGESTRFWLDHWIGIAPLKDIFPRLYNISLQMDHTIQQMATWVNDKWIWHIKWMRIFFTWEEELERDLRSMIGEVVWGNLGDAVKCIFDVKAFLRNDKIFSTKDVGAEELFDQIQVTS